MYLPFLTCEVKCGAAALDVADQQNAHSMTLAVRSVIELYKAVKREKELHREFLPFQSHTIIALDGKDKWMAYKFTNVYDVWMPLHLKRICSAIDELPSDINFDLSQVASFSQSEPQSSQQSNAKYTEMLGEDDSQPSVVGSQKVTPTTSFTETTERASKKLRSKRAACLK
ncbi:MAG: hypothetical protein MMC33_002058 [Icmadophila ericetorum]|nr:hypothetical protein [Icmadophila ericetorum]